MPAINISVRADQKRKSKEQLEMVLLEALKSEPETGTPEWWARLRKESLASPSRTGHSVPEIPARWRTHSCVPVFTLSRNQVGQARRLRRPRRPPPRSFSYAR